MKTTVTTAAGAVAEFETIEDAVRFCHGLHLADVHGGPNRSLDAERDRVIANIRTRFEAARAYGAPFTEADIVWAGCERRQDSEGVAQLPSQGAGSKDREEARDTSTGATKPVDAGESPAPLHLSTAGAGAQGAPVDGDSAAPAPAPAVDPWKVIGRSGPDVPNDENTYSRYRPGEGIVKDAAGPAERGAEQSDAGGLPLPIIHGNPCLGCGAPGTRDKTDWCLRCGLGWDACGKAIDGGVCNRVDLHLGECQRYAPFEPKYQAALRAHQTSAPAPRVPVCHPMCGTTECPAKHGGKCITPCGQNGEHWCTGLCRDLGRPLNRPAQYSNDSHGTSGEAGRHATDGTSSAKAPYGDEVPDAVDPREGKVPGNGTAQSAAPSASGAADQEPAGRRDASTPQNTEVPAQAGVGRLADGGVLPCPFCGGTDISVQGAEGGVAILCVRCRTCGTGGPITVLFADLGKRTVAERLWNQRATEAKAGGAV